MRAACALVVLGVSLSAPGAAATQGTLSEACRNGERQDGAQAVDDDIRIVDNDGWYYLFATQTSVWRESNDQPGLQTEARICEVSQVDGTTWTYLYSYVKWQPDTLLLGVKAGPGGASAQACVC